MVLSPHRPRGPVGPCVSTDGVFAALVALGADDPLPIEERKTAWLAITTFVRRVLPADADADARQAALLAILESVKSLRATTPARAAAWVRVVCRNELIDLLRCGRGSRLTSLDDPADPIELDGATPLSRDAAHRVVDAFVERIELHLRTRYADPVVRERRLVQALATLRRTALEESLPEIARHLDLTISLELLTKWIERGRKVIVDTVEADRVLDPDAADLFAPFADLARGRRADAGRRRPARRRASS